MILTIPTDTRILSTRLKACAHRVHTATTGFTTADALGLAASDLDEAEAAIAGLRAQLNALQGRAQ